MLVATEERDTGAGGAKAAAEPKAIRVVKTEISFMMTKN